METNWPRWISRSSPLRTSDWLGGVGADDFGELTGGEEGVIGGGSDGGPRVGGEVGEGLEGRGGGGHLEIVAGLASTRQLWVIW